MRKYNVLIFPAGSEIAFEIYNSLKYNLHFNVYGASGKSDHARFVYSLDRYIEGDHLYITDGNFVENFNKVIEQFGIDFIFPTHDSIALFLLESQDLINAKVICSNLETTRISRSKKKTYDYLQGDTFVPKTYKSIHEVDEYPVFVKPDIGEGSKNATIINNRFEFENKYANNDNFVISEYLPGKEYTVDCFTNSSGKLLFVGPRTRKRITMGISFRSERVKLNEEILEITYKLNQIFSFRGSWFFQVKADRDGYLKLMEFSVRQASTMGLYRQLGINFALLSLFDFIGHDVKILFNDYNIMLDRRLHNSYCFEYDYNKLYVDFDDTLIVNGKVNTLLIRLIYQCVNSNKQVILLTKHKNDLSESLSKYRIDRKLFDEIVVIGMDKNKADYIDGTNAIFIDNHFPERLLVNEKCNIPVFDVDAIECLIDSSAI